MGHSWSLRNSSTRREMHNFIIRLHPFPEKLHGKQSHGLGSLLIDEETETFYKDVIRARRLDKTQFTTKLEQKDRETHIMLATSG